MATALISLEMNLVCPAQSHPVDWTKPVARKEAWELALYNFTAAFSHHINVNTASASIVLREACWYDREGYLVCFKKLKDLRP